MELLFVIICTIIVIVLVILAVKNRKRLNEQDVNNSAVNVEPDNKYESSNSDIMDKERFSAELSRAGFRDETIEDMYDKISNKKGSVSLLDALAIIHALDPIMKIRKDDD